MRRFIWLRNHEHCLLEVGGEIFSNFMCQNVTYY